MSRSQFASAHPQPVPVVTVHTGAGSLSGAGTLYFAIQARCRGGWTEVSGLVQATYAAGDSITVQIPASARAAGDDIRRWEILASTSNDATTLKTIGWVEGYALDEITPISLPANLVLSQDAHIAISASVADPAALPTGTSLIHGMVRRVISLAKYFRYNINSIAVVDGSTVLAAATGRWEMVGNDSTWIPDREGDPGGCDRDVRLIDDADVLFPVYPGDGSAGIPVDLVWVHDPGINTPLPQGTRFTLSVLINEANKSALFRGKLKLIFRGFVNLADGSLDTSDGDGGTMVGVGSIVTYQPEKTGLILQKDLPQGYGYLVSVYPEFALWELRDELGINSTVRVFLYPFSQAGNYSEAGQFLGSVVYPSGNYLRVVPGANLSAIVLDGGAIIDSYSFLKNPVTPIAGLLPNQAGQQICINGNGAVFLRAGAVPDSEGIRALVSTESGQGVLSPASSVLALAGTSIQVTVEYPSDEDGSGTIRDDYPDSQLAGFTDSQVVFNPPMIRLFVQNITTSTIREFSFSVVPGSSQIFVISDWSAGTVVGSIPAASNAAQGLFVPGTPSLIESGVAGNLTAGNYQVTAAFYCDGNQISQIDGESTPALPILPDTIDTLLRQSLPYARLADSFVQPAVAGSVTVTVDNARVFGVGGSVVINTAGNVFQGGYSLTAKTDTTLTLVNLGLSGSVAPGVTVPVSGYVFPSGAPGPVGPAGSTIHPSPTNPPDPALGEIGDYALTSIDPATLFGPKTGDGWGAGMQLVGDAGADGLNGTDGRTILPTTGVPGAEIGVDGDFALDPAASLLYGPKTAGAWGSPVSIKGDPGVNGRTILNGTGIPGAEIGVDGDFYLNTTANDIYGPKTAGAWGSPTSLIGPTGASGSVSAASGLTLEHIATPSAPAAGNTIVYAKDDGLLYYLPAGGSESAISSGGGTSSGDGTTEVVDAWWDGSQVTNWARFQSTLNTIVAKNRARRLTSGAMTTPAGSYPGGGAYAGGVLLSDGRVFCVPYGVTTARIYDPATDTLTTPTGTYPGGGAYYGGVLLPDGRVFCVPIYATSARIYDPATNTLTTPAGTYPGSSAYIGGVLLPDGRVFCVPTYATSARIYDPATDTLTTPAGTYPGGGAYIGGVLLPDGRVFCVPSSATTARIYDPATDTLTTPAGTYPGSDAYYGGVLLPDGRVFCVPHSATSARIYDPTNDTLTTPAGTYPGGGAYYGGVLLPDGRVFCVPINATTARIYDPTTDTLITPAGSYPGGGAYVGGVLLPDGRVFCVPYVATTARISATRSHVGLDSNITLSPFFNKL